MVKRYRQLTGTFSLSYTLDMGFSHMYGEIQNLFFFLHNFFCILCTARHKYLNCLPVHTLNLLQTLRQITHGFFGVFVLLFFLLTDRFCNLHTQTIDAVYISKHIHKPCCLGSLLLCQGTGRKHICQILIDLLC